MTRIIDLEAALRACDGFDWAQPADSDWNPCFWLDHDGRFCGRAERWAGHHSYDRHAHHTHISLRTLIEALLSDQSAHLREVMLECSRDIWHMSMEHISDRLREEAEKL